MIKLSTVIESHWQYCKDGSNYTGPVPSWNAHEARLWVEDGTLIVTLTHDGANGLWRVSASDTYDWTEDTRTWMDPTAWTSPAVDTVHIVSSTAITAPGDPVSLAMCGEALGTYKDATAAGHRVYIWSRGVAARYGVTCALCIERSCPAAEIE